MKNCPTCKKIYTDDSLVYCLQDGATLQTMSDAPTSSTVDETLRDDAAVSESIDSAPTEILDPQPAPTTTINRPANTTQSLRLTTRAVVIGVLLLALAGIGIALLFRGLGSRAGSSPTATLKAFYEAIQKKDAEALKKTLSKGTLEMFEGFAKAQNKTLDDSLKSGLANSSDPEAEKLPESRNEKIEGDKATLEVKNNKTNSWETVPFVKEDGAWKIAFDQVFRDAMKKMGDTGK